MLVEAVSGETPSYIGNFSGCTVVRVVGMVMQGANHSKNKKKKKKKLQFPWTRNASHIVSKYFVIDVISYELNVNLSFHKKKKTLLFAFSTSLSLNAHGQVGGSCQHCTEFSISVKPIRYWETQRPEVRYLPKYEYFISKLIGLQTSLSSAGNYLPHISLNIYCSVYRC